jgi:hypothetical protein
MALNRRNDLNAIRRLVLYASHLLSGRPCPVSSGAISLASAVQPPPTAYGMSCEGHSYHSPAKATGLVPSE